MRANWHILASDSSKNNRDDSDSLNSNADNSKFSALENYALIDYTLALVYVSDMEIRPTFSLRRNS